MTAPARLVLDNCLIIDAASPSPREGSVLIVDGRIEEVSPTPRAGRSGSRDARVIDLQGGFLLPGFWDAHTHIGRGIPDDEARDETAAARALRAGRDCLRALRLGITGLRVVGERDYIDVACRDAFASGDHLGPTLFTCGYFITTTAGHFLSSGCAVEADGPVGFRKAVREQIKHGVDFIKLNMDGGVMGPPWDRTTDVYLLPDEIASVFDLCRQRDFRVVAHAAGVDGVKAAVRAGAHSIEHGYVLDDEAASMMVERGTYYVPTMGLTHLNRGPEFAESEFEREWTLANPRPEAYRQRAIAAAGPHADAFKRALKAGVKIACGSDLALPWGGLLEMAMLVRCGMSEWQAIVAATRTAAEVCLADDDYGAVEPGKRADLVALTANPLDDIEAARAPSLVVKGGQVVTRPGPA